MIAKATRALELSNDSGFHNAAYLRRKRRHYFVGVFNKTIIPLAKMIIANSYPTHTRGIIVSL